MDAFFVVLLKLFLIYFFHCDIINEFWIRVLNGHPQGRNCPRILWGSIGVLS